MSTTAAADRRSRVPTWSRIGVSAVAAALLLAGCGTDSGSSSPSSAHGCAASSTSGAAGAGLLPVPPTSVTVIDPGTTPHRVPAGSPDRTSPQSATLTTTSSVESTTDTSRQTVTTPLTARFSCSDATDLEMTLGRSTSPDSELGGALAATAGTTGGLGLGPGGAPISLRLLPPKEASSAARSAVEQSLVQAFRDSVPLPTDPIGVGATWRAQRTITTAATVTQTTTAHLTAWEGNRLAIDVEVDETPVNSVFSVPGADTTLSISRYSFTGTGQLHLDLTRALPTSGSLDASGARELVGADPARPLVQRTGFSLRWE